MSFGPVAGPPTLYDFLPSSQLEVLAFRVPVVCRESTSNSTADAGFRAREKAVRFGIHQRVVDGVRARVDRDGLPDGLGNRGYLKIPQFGPFPVPGTRFGLIFACRFSECRRFVRLVPIPSPSDLQFNRRAIP